MSGNSSIANFEIAQGYTLTVPGPIDDRTTISSVSALSSELLIGVRYVGLPVWVSDEQMFYTFVGSTDDINFISYRTLLGSGSNVAIAFNYDFVIPAGTTLQLVHNLNSVNLHVTCYNGLTPILLDWSVIDVNSIQISTDANIANLRIVMLYAGILASNPAQSLPSSDLSVTKLTNIATAQTFVLQPTEKLLAIDYRYVSGSPIVRAGTTANDDDVHTDVTVINTDDSNVPLQLTKPALTNIHITVTGGVVNISRTVQLSVF